MESIEGIERTETETAFSISKGLLVNLLSSAMLRLSPILLQLYYMEAYGMQDMVHMRVWVQRYLLLQEI